MSALSPILRSLAGEGGERMVAFWCPGCDEPHAITVSTAGQTAKAWGWDGSVDAPTFTPSLLVRGTKRLTDDEIARLRGGERIEPVPQRCHSFVRGGKIEFLSDCSHALAGTTVSIPTWPEGFADGDE